MKVVKVLTVILLIVLITMIGFFGIYSQELNYMKNQINGYEYSKNLEGKRVIRLRVSDSTYNIVKDSEGNIVKDSENLKDEEIETKGYIKEEFKYNNDEEKIQENFTKSKEIIEKRLSELSINDYIVKLDEKNGDIIVELPEYENTDFVVSNMYGVGNFKIVDTKTQDVLMDNNDIKDVVVKQGAARNSRINEQEVYLINQFNKEGTKKLEDISNKYVPIENDINIEDSGTENSEKVEKEKNSITMKVDDVDIMSTEFTETIKTGELSLVMGKATAEQGTLEDNIKQATSMATVMKNGEMPLKYDVIENQFIKSNILEENLIYVAYGILILLLLVVVIFTVKFKFNGLLSSLAIIGLISIVTLIIRYTNVVLSIEGIMAIIIIILLQIYFIYRLLTKTKDGSNVKTSIRETYKEFFSVMIPIAIISITFSFMSLVPISSFGMIIFWGLIVIAVYNITITNILIRIKMNK